VRKSFWWILVAVGPAVTLAAMTATSPNLDKALEAQRALAAEYPEDARVFNDLGNLLVLAGDLDQAEQAYLYALELDPRKVSARFNLALLLQQTGRYKPAVEQYRQVLELDPNHAWAHYQMGSLYDHWRQDALAVKFYARAFALDPQLAFPEVNPHVIDNRLLTEALLVAHRGTAVSPMAPKAYDEPSRIAQLLVPPIPLEPEEEEEDEEAVAEEESETPPPKRLTRGDLDPNAPANQAAPPAYGRGSRYQPPSRFRQPPRNLRQFQQRSRPSTPPTTQPRTRGGGGRTLGNTVGQPGTGGQDATDRRNPLAGRTRRGDSARPSQPNEQPVFRPSGPSTGRLEIELIPARPPHAAEELAAG